MATKRNIREELKNVDKGEMFKVLRETFKLAFKEVPLWAILYTFFTLTYVAVPIATLLLLQEIINDAVLGSINNSLLLIFIAVSLLSTFWWWVRPFLRHMFSTKLRIQSSIKLYDKLNGLRIQDFESKDLHNNFNIANSSVDIMPSLFNTIIHMVTEVIAAISYFVVIFIWQPVLILFLLPFPIVSFIIKYRKLKNNFIERWELSENKRKANYYSWVLREQKSLNEVKVLNVNDSYYDKFVENYVDVRYKERNLSMAMMKLNLIVDVINDAIRQGFFVYLLINLVNGNLLIGNFNTYRTSINAATNNLDYFGNYLADLNVQLIEVREYFKFMSYESDFVEGKVEIDKIDTIEFKNVYYKYPSGKKSVLKNINFKLSKGEKIAFIGENGSGKTTIMKLMLKIYLPTRGRILINGIPTSKINTKSLRKHTSMLLQDFNLFEETIRDNITLGVDDGNAKKIYNRIPFSDLEDKIKEQDKKLNTVLGSWFGDGINFSKGQVQKLALSRIFYRDTDCILLDEPNSALDPRSEKNLFKYIDSKIHNKICVSTLHVFTNIDIMNRVIMFDNGKIVADGSHKELYNNSEVYTEYYNLQERDEEDMKDVNKRQ